MISIPQYEPSFDEAEAEALKEYILAGGWVTEFRKTQEFEQKFAAFVGAKFAIATTSGTSALFLALQSLGIKAGDEVLVPDLTMVATANAVRLCGAEPVFVDIESKTLCLDPVDVIKKISPRAKAIIHVSLNGRAGSLNELSAIAKERNLFLIEDAAQSLGSYLDVRHLGTIGEIGCFSFSAPKIISTGQGGILVTNNSGLADRLRMLKDFGRKNAGVDEHQLVAGNFKFTDVQAVIGLEQLKKLSQRMLKKKNLYAMYEKELGGLSSVRMLATDLHRTTPWFVDIYVDQREGLRSFLEKKGIGTRPIYGPVHSQPCFAKKEKFPQAELAAQEGLWLPSSFQLSEAQVRLVCSNIREFFRS
jgi:perosamine synthetase